MTAFVAAGPIFCSAALAQSAPCFIPTGGSTCRALQTGDVPSAAQWNSMFEGYQNVLSNGSVLAAWLAPGAAASNIGAGGVTASMLAKRRGDFQPRLHAAEPDE